MTQTAFQEEGLCVLLIALWVGVLDMLVQGVRAQESRLIPHTRERRILTGAMGAIWVEG